MAFAMNTPGFPNKFPAILVFLSVLAFPLFFFVWGIVPVTNGIYIELLIIFGSLFLMLLFGGNWVEKKWADAARDLYTIYLVTVAPGLTVIASLAILGTISAVEYQVGLLLLHFAVILFWGFGRKALSSSLGVVVTRFVAIFSPVGFALVLWLWLYKTYGVPYGYGGLGWLVILAGLLLIPVCLWVFDLPESWLTQRSYAGVYILTALLLVGLVYRPELFIQRWHYDYFMAPINDVLHGKMLFVDSTSQYGVGLIYFLALTFRVLQMPVGYYGLSFIVAVLFIMQYLLLAFMLFKTTQRTWISLFGLFTIVYFNYLSVYWQSMLRTPAQSPLRYGLIYLLLSMALINSTSSNRFWRMVELVLLGISSVWSLETFLFTIISLDAYYFVKVVMFAPVFMDGLKPFLKRVSIQLGVIVVFWAAAIFYCWLSTSQLPDLQIYLDYFRFMSKPRLMADEAAAHVFRTFAVTFFYLASIFYVLYDRVQRQNLLSPGVAAMMAGMSAAGILQYFYYFIYNIDYHLSLLCVPLVFLMTLWVAVLQPHDLLPKALKRSIVISFLISLFLCVNMTLPRVSSIASKSLLYKSASKVLRGSDMDFKNPYIAEPTNQTVKNLLDLIEEYAKEDPQIVIFARNEDEVEALMLSGKTHLLDISDPEMVDISPYYTRHVMSRAELFAGSPEVIFMDKREDRLLPFQLEILQILTSSADYVVVDKIDNIVVIKKVK